MASTKVMESLSGFTAATVDPSGETATADEETAPARGGGAVEVGDGVGVGNSAGGGVGTGADGGVCVGGVVVGSGVGTGVCTTAGPEVGVGLDVAVGVGVADGPVHAASTSPRVAKKGIAVGPEDMRIISSSCRYPHRPG